MDVSEKIFYIDLMSESGTNVAWHIARWCGFHSSFFCVSLLGVMVVQE